VVCAGKRALPLRPGHRPDSPYCNCRLSAAGCRFPEPVTIPFMVE